jgi:hypothetical protein
VESNEKSEIYKKDDTTVTVSEYEMTTKWYAGEDRVSRVSTVRMLTWKNRRYTSRGFQWDEIEEFIKQIQDGYKD